MMTDKEKRLLDPNFGNGSMLMRPEDSSIQKASDDFMDYLNNPTLGMSGMNGLQPTEDYDAMLEQEMLDREMTERNEFDKLKGNGTPPVVPVVNKPDMSTVPKVGSNTGTNSGNKPPVPPTDPKMDILAQLKAAREENAMSMNKARGIDDSVELANALNKSFNQIGTGVANQAGYTKIASNPLEVSSDEAKFASGSNKERIDALMQEYGIKKGIEDSELAKKQAAQSRQDRLNDKAEDRDYKNKMLKLQEAKILAQGKKNEAITPFEKALEQNVAKEASQWVTGNRATVLSDIEKLKAVEKQLEKGGNNVSGELLGRVPFVQDIINSEGNEIENTIATVTQKNLKEILGGQFAQKEGEDLLKRGYDRKVPEEKNLERVKSLRQAMEKAAKDKDIAVTNYSKGGNANDLLKLQLTEENKQIKQETSKPSVGSIIKTNGKRYKIINDVGDLEEIK